MANLRLLSKNSAVAVNGSANSIILNNAKSIGYNTGKIRVTSSPISGSVLVGVYMPNHLDSISACISTAASSTVNINNSSWTEPVLYNSDLRVENIILYKRSIEVPTVYPDILEYNSIDKTIIGESNGWFILPPVGEDPLYAITSPYVLDNSLEVNTWSTPIVVTDPSAVYSTIQYIYYTGNTPPALVTTGNSIYNLGTGILGGTIPSGWSTIEVSTGQVWVRIAALLSTSTTFSVSSDMSVVSEEELPSGYGGGKYLTLYLHNIPNNSTEYIITFNRIVKVSKIILGNYWSPKYNFPYGISVGFEDLSTYDRLQNGDLHTMPGPRHKVLKFDLEYISEEDKFNLFKIIKTVGKSGYLWISPFPEILDKEKEQMYTIYGKLSSISEISLTQYTRYTSSISIEEF